MRTQFPRIDELPHWPSSQARDGWDDLVRQVRSSGTIAIMIGDQVDAVVMDVRRYQEIVELVESVKPDQTAGPSRDPALMEAGLAELTADFDRRLASMTSDGRTPTRPKAGESH